MSKAREFLNRFNENPSSEYDKKYAKAMGIQAPDDWDLGPKPKEPEHYLVTWTKDGHNYDGPKNRKVMGYKSALRVVQALHQETGFGDGALIQVETVNPASGSVMGTQVYAERFTNGKWERDTSREAMFRHRQRGRTVWKPEQIVVMKDGKLAKVYKAEPGEDGVWVQRVNKGSSWVKNSDLREATPEEERQFWDSQKVDL